MHDVKACLTGGLPVLAQELWLCPVSSRQGGKDPLACPRTDNHE